MCVCDVCARLSPSLGGLCVQTFTEGGHAWCAGVCVCVLGERTCEYVCIECVCINMCIEYFCVSPLSECVLGVVHTLIS